MRWAAALGFMVAGGALAEPFSVCRDPGPGTRERVRVRGIPLGGDRLFVPGVASAAFAVGGGRLRCGVGWPLPANRRAMGAHRSIARIEAA